MADDDGFVDHYLVLDLPSGEEGAKLTLKEISKAYKRMALLLHPDKRKDDPNADANFQKLKSSYEILKDDKTRKLFDELLKIKRDRQLRQSQSDSKRRRMVSDLEERERTAFAPDSSARARAQEVAVARKLKEEIARVRAMHARRGVPEPFAAPNKESSGVGESARSAEAGLDKNKILKVSWVKGGLDYSAERLRKVFSEFGDVEDVVIKGSKKKGSALVVMATADGAVAATGSLCGDLSNPLLVLPLQPTIPTEIPFVQKPAEPVLGNNLVGAGYHAFEDSVLEKLQKGPFRKTDGPRLKQITKKSGAKVCEEDDKGLK